MPRAAEEIPSSRPNTRRSSRLNNRQGSKNNVVVEIIPPKSKRRKLSRPETTIQDTAQEYVQDAPPAPKVCTALDLRRSKRITPTELIKREKTLLHKEQECKRKADELDERILSLSKKEDEASLIMSQIAEREARAILSQLDEYFTCPLCYEIMAHPYTLNPGQCGHTFCAICILKWFFSRLHRTCGAWHESVDCPICRSLLVITPELVPRLDITFPFVPNRTTATMCESLIEKLAHSPSGSLIIKREDSEGMWSSESRSERTIECTRKQGKSEEGEIAKESPDMAGWREGGILRAEWLKKDREGKTEMNHLLKFWSTLRSDDFVALKQKLGV